jgi:hypothetical protein
MRTAQRWRKETTHGKGCTYCDKAAAAAKSQAIVSGSVECTYTLDYPKGYHSATVTRPAAHPIETTGQ